MADNKNSDNLQIDHQSLNLSSAWRALINRKAKLTVSIFFILLLLGTFFFRDLLDVAVITANFFSTESADDSVTEAAPIIPKPSLLNCTNPNTCKINNTVAFDAQHQSTGATCPEYFRWIHEDLRPWNSTGISREALESAKPAATFRLVITNGTVYWERFHWSFQTRDLFTIWGILQLLKLYPGRVPDVELMFQCGDMPEIRKDDSQGSNSNLPPPLFQYSGSDKSVSIVFPDWSFWGWAEVDIRPWTSMLEGIVKGSERKNWTDRTPYAYWRGNYHTSPNRKEFMRCKKNIFHDYNARLYNQEWSKETHRGFKHSHLEDQCTYRYKIYVEGRSWSVSDKYILACDSMTLLIEPEYYDFFMRSISPMQHYWPIRKNKKCKDIKFAVEWGNTHPDVAEKIGKGGSEYIEENLKMEYVYDYMLNLLIEYSKLMRFKPEIPQGAAFGICSESVGCKESGLVREFLEESIVLSPSSRLPCGMPPPYDSAALHDIFEKKGNATRQILLWQKEFKKKKS